MCGVCGRSYSTATNLDRHEVEVHNGDGKKCRRCGRSYASRGQLVNHASREQVKPHPRILVRDRHYDDSPLAPLSTYLPELSEIYNTNWPSIRSSRYNRWYQDSLNCRFLRVAGDPNSTPPSEALVRVWNNLDCVVKINVRYESYSAIQPRKVKVLLKQRNCVPGGHNNNQSCSTSCLKHPKVSTQQNLG